MKHCILSFKFLEAALLQNVRNSVTFIFEILQVLETALSATHEIVKQCNAIGKLQKCKDFRWALCTTNINMKVS